MIMIMLTSNPIEIAQSMAAQELLDLINMAQIESLKRLAEGREEMRNHHTEQKSYISQIRVDMVDIANQSAQAITKIHELKRVVESGFDDLFAVFAALLVEVWSMQGVFYYSIMMVRPCTCMHIYTSTYTRNM